MDEAEPHADAFSGWWIVAGAFVIYFVSGGLFNTATVFFKAISGDLGLSRAALSGAFSLGFLVSGLSAPLWGRVADRHGARAAFIPGVLLTGTLCALLSRIHSLTSLYFGYVAFTFASAGISLVPVSVLISRWFVVRRGRAMGIAFMGEGFGALAITPLAGLLVGYLGWRDAYLAAGAAVVVLLLPVVLFLKDAPRRVEQRAAAGAARSQGSGALPGTAGVSLSDALRIPVFWLVAVTWLLAMTPLAAITLHQVPYLTDLGMSVQHASIVAGSAGGMGILGRLAFGILSERFAIRRIYAVCYLLMAAGIAALWLVPRLGLLALVAYVSLFGIAVGGAFALAALLVAHLFGVGALGEVFGLLGLAATMGGAAGGVGAGLMYDSLGGYDAVFAVAVALSLVATALMLRVRTTAPRDTMQPDV